MSVAPSEVELPQSGERTTPDTPWLTIVWNDPINLMDYVTYVFQTVFNYPKPKARKLMLDVFTKMLQAVWVQRVADAEGEAERVGGELVEPGRGEPLVLALGDLQRALEFRDGKMKTDVVIQNRSIASEVLPTLPSLDEDLVEAIGAEAPKPTNGDTSAK